MSATTIEKLKQQVKGMENNRPLITDKKLLQTAFAQEIATAVCFEDEESGSRMYAALEKAMKNIETNKTIHFGGGVLSFVSQDSNKQRVVTKSGCSNFCDCGNQYSYHRATFAILGRYFALAPPAEIKPENAPYFSGGYTKAVKREKIGGVFV